MARLAEVRKTRRRRCAASLAFYVVGRIRGAKHTARGRRPRRSRAPIDRRRERQARLRFCHTYQGQSGRSRLFGRLPLERRCGRAGCISHARRKRGYQGTRKTFSSHHDARRRIVRAHIGDWPRRCCSRVARQAQGRRHASRQVVDRRRYPAHRRRAPFMERPLGHGFRSRRQAG